MIEAAKPAVFDCSMTACCMMILDSKGYDDFRRNEKVLVFWPAGIWKVFEL